MNSIIKNRIARIVVVPIAAAGVAAGVVLGLAGPANATASDSSIVAVPHTYAQPAPTATPGSWWHRHHPSLLDPTTAVDFTKPGT